jgi:hypothetical protein
MPSVGVGPAKELGRTATSSGSTMAYSPDSEISLLAANTSGSDNGDIAACSSRVVEHPASIPAQSTSPIRRLFFAAGKSRTLVRLRGPAPQMSLHEAVVPGNPGRCAGFGWRQQAKNAILFLICT